MANCEEAAEEAGEEQPVDEDIATEAGVAAEVLNTHVQTVISFIRVGHRREFNDRNQFEYDQTLKVMLRRLRQLYGDDPAENQEYVRGAD